MQIQKFQLFYHHFRSPDGKYIVTGGEDDLVNVYSVAERRIVVRGQGHKSWVSVVAFDSFNMSYGAVPDGLDFSGKRAGVREWKRKTNEYLISRYPIIGWLLR